MKLVTDTERRQNEGHDLPTACIGVIYFSHLHSNQKTKKPLYWRFAERNKLSRSTLIISSLYIIDTKLHVPLLARSPRR